MIYIKESPIDPNRKKRSVFWPYTCTHPDIAEFRTIETIRFRDMGADLFTITFKNRDDIKIIFEGLLTQKQLLLDTADRYIYLTDKIDVPCEQENKIEENTNLEMIENSFSVAGYDRSLLENLKTRILNLEKKLEILETIKTN